jgi:hypothetical protein
MNQRFASRIDHEGLLNVAIDEVSDADLEKAFQEKPELADLVGVPRYWAPKFGYWPKPSQEWTCHVREDEV